MLMKTEQSLHALPLHTVKAGETVKITGFTGSKNLMKRIFSLGLLENSEVHVLQQHKRGIVVACGETRLALGVGIAHHIMVIAN
jgi:ferrous iron transport protein A